MKIPFDLDFFLKSAIRIPKFMGILEPFLIS
jgi:hypothetical protein